LPEIGGDAAEYFYPLDKDSILTALKNVVFSPVRKNELKIKGQNRLS
jgi:hypothetical protein